MKQLEMLYEGKAKQIFRTDDPERIIIRYKDTATAFNNIKKATIENKGGGQQRHLVDHLPRAGAGPA